MHFLPCPVVLQHVRCMIMSCVQVGAPHRVTKEDAIKWFQTKFEGVVLNKAHAY